MKKHDLRKYTKEELIWLIENVGGFGWERRIGEVLFELDYKRVMKKLDEADSHAKKAHAARERYIEIMKPYEGRRISDIPIGVLDKARAAIEQAEREERLYDRSERAVRAEEY